MADVSGIHPELLLPILKHTDRDILGVFGRRDGFQMIREIGLMYFMAYQFYSYTKTLGDILENIKPESGMH